jgi:dynein heavy chain, axonemal
VGDGWSTVAIRRVSEIYPIPLSPSFALSLSLFIHMCSFNCEKNIYVYIYSFETFQSELNEAAPRFLDWFSHPSPESEKLPLEWKQLDQTPFKKLLVIRVLRPDRLNEAIKKLIKYVMPNGDNFTDLDSNLNSFQVLDLVFKNSSADVPVFFIVSRGADVVADVDKLALK